MVGLDVQLDLALEAELQQEGVDGCGIVIVLMFGRLHRLRLVSSVPLKPMRWSVLDHQVHEAAELPPLGGRSVLSSVS